MYEVSDHCYIVGKITEYTLTSDELATIRQSLGISSVAQNVQKFEKLILNQAIFYTSRPSRISSGTQNNSFCMVSITDGHSAAAHIGIGEILSFYKPENHLQPIAILRKYAILPNKTPISDSRPPMIHAIRSLDVHSHLQKQFIELKPYPNTGINGTEQEIIAIPIQCIIRKCILIKSQIILYPFTKLF